MNKNKIWIATAVLFFGLSEGQQSAVFNQKNTFSSDLASQLYTTKVFAASQYQYTQQYLYHQSLTQSQKEVAGFYTHLIDVILQNPNAEKGLDTFIANHPNTEHFAEGQAPLADFYLIKKDFPKALEILNKLNVNHLSSSEQTQHSLKLGYAKFMSGDSKAAIKDLENAYTSSEDSEKGDIAYMLGHLYYTEGQTGKAFEYFNEIKDKEKYSKIVKPYFVQMYFNDENYDLAIAEGEMLLKENLSSSYKSEVHKIIGESYFMKGEYRAAYPHLKVFLDSKEAPSESDLYEMGFVAAQMGLYDEAVSYYSQLVNSQSALSQNAYYQLGNAYLETNKKQEALSAFRSAYQMSYDAKVKKLAHLQYAKLSYDIGNPYESSSSVIQSYIHSYKDTSPEMQTLLVKSYLYSGNYKETLSALNQINTKTTETDKIEQEVAYLLGTEEFNKGNYKEAELYFKKSLKFNHNQEFYLKAQYWLAQTYYQLEDYPSAISYFEKLQKTEGSFDERSQISYDLGYAYFKNKDFGKAKECFKLYLKNPKAEFKADAELRLADTHYADNELNDAIAIYNNAETTDEYTLFQKAMALGFKGDTEAKISEMKKLVAQYPNSEYKDDALYEIGTAYAANDEFALSSEYFDKVVKTSTDTHLIANAEIYIVQNDIEQNQEAKAFSGIKALAKKYQNTVYADKVLVVARSLYLKTGDTAGYQDFAKNLGVGLDKSEIDEINLSTARQLYAKKQYEKAIPYYEKYLTQNVSSNTAFQAQYELGESYYQNGDDAKALKSFNFVTAYPNDYQEEARLRSAQILLSKNKGEEAAEHLAKLVDSNNPKIKSFAQQELMKYYADKKDFAKAETYAGLILSNTKNSPAVLEQAKVIKARSLMNQGKDKEAQKSYTDLEKSSNPSVAAEALYAKAYYQNKAKAFKNSNESIFKLANNYASEEYWGAKSLVLMARNYLALKDKYQASYTCDQVIANYQDFPDVVAEAKEVKKMIK
ncbi:hypothetical protein D1000_05935 [Riemerella anatipestifer]|uniref:tetratricopeptide repeat protein n=1 Tax=Riemerella anatipestifer TaxID=34085 RepID=UPI00129D2F24|nr:tetratricopeptide repeat protein [Riemerella anatipestifer]MDR7693856.1 tetratricopeptide repeat protein [Riemerella anatipestifer]MDR7793845.1 tetratricopeptide repeat protein [Riemerella anatipestifer]MRN16361.1 hypothetical protein [Riemerella anatipestifer]